MLRTRLALLGGFLFLGRLPAASLVVDLKGGGDYTDIQSAIDAAADGDTVLVRPGEYVIAEPIDFNRLHDPEDPASPLVKNIALRSEGGSEVTTIRMSEAPADPARASVVVFESWETSASILEGFTVTGGGGMGKDYWSGGGGIWISANSAPSIARCRIWRNNASIGAGVLCAGAATLAGCDVSENCGDFEEGGCAGIRCEGAAVVESSLVRRNAGSGIECSGATTVRDCVIAENLAGAGLVCRGGSPMVTDCTVTRNAAGRGSRGGVFCADDDSSRPTLHRCRIAGNAGGGLVCGRRSAPELMNCVIYGNAAGYGGGGVDCAEAAAPLLINCTVAGNVVRDHSRGAAAIWGDGSVAIRLANCVIWGNSPNSVVGSADHNVATLDPSFRKTGLFDFVRFEDVGQHYSWCYWSQLFSVPDFVVEEPDYHLQPGSPCIDAGTSEGAPATDIEGNARPCGAGVDIGAYESGDCEVVPAPFQRADSNADGTVDISDPVATLGYLFGGTDVLPCLDAADADDSGELDISDAIFCLGFQFLGGRAPPAPFGACGPDGTEDELGCESFPACP